MLKKTASMQKAWKARMAARRDQSSLIRHGMSSMQVVHPSWQGRHSSKFPESTVPYWPAYWDELFPGGRGEFGSAMYLKSDCQTLRMQKKLYKMSEEAGKDFLLHFCV